MRMERPLGHLTFRMMISNVNPAITLCWLERVQENQGSSNCVSARLRALLRRISAPEAKTISRVKKENIIKLGPGVIFTDRAKKVISGR